MTYAVRTADLAEPERLETFAPELDTTAPLTIFRIRCETFALLVATGELDLHTAVDLLRDEADANGFDTDTAQAIMDRAFRPASRAAAQVQAIMDKVFCPAADKPRRRNYRFVSEDGVATPAELERLQTSYARRRDGAPETTIEALKYAYAHAQQHGNAKVFQEPANKERLSRLSPRQRKELIAWIEKHERSKAA